MPEKTKQEQKETRHPLQEVEKSAEKQIANLMTFLAEPRAVAPVYETVLAMVERAMLKVAMERNGNVKSKAATYLGINRNSLQAKMVRLGLEQKTDV